MRKGRKCAKKTYNQQQKMQQASQQQEFLPTFSKKVVDLFCGCGGTSLGFQQAGWNPVCAVDMNKYALDTYKCNFPDAEVIQGDLTDESLQNYIIQKYKGVDAVLGGPPCQGFSKRNMNPSERHQKMNQLPLLYANIAIQLQPNVIFMEEVPAAINVVQQVADILQKANYTVQYKTLYASDYGVPQKRKRLILVAYTHKLSFNFPNKQQQITVRQAFNIHPIPIQGKQVTEKTKQKIIHLQKTNTRLIGGNYQIMDIDKPSPTIHTQTRSSTGPYTILSNKNTLTTLSTQQAARIQSFPHNFIFKGSDTQTRTQIGNAVPPTLANKIASNFFKKS